MFNSKRSRLNALLWTCLGAGLCCGSPAEPATAKPYIPQSESVLLCTESRLPETSFDATVFLPSSALQEKTAMFPEYQFTKVRETWHAASDLTLKAEPYEDSQTAAKANQSRPLQITGKNKLDYWEAKVDGKVVYVAQKDIVHSKSEVFEDIDKTSVYALRNTQHYASPNAAGATGKAIPYGTKINITARNDAGWLRWTGRDGTMHYLIAEAFTEDASLIFEDCSEEHWTDRDCYLLDGPNPDADVICSLESETKLTVTGTNSSGYARTEVDGQTGFINEDYLLSSKPERKPAASSSSQPSSNASYDSSDYQLEVMCAVVRQEGGGSYESSLAVMSSAVNRANSSRWRYMGATPFQQLTAPGQYSYSIDSHWQRYMGFNVPNHVIQAVKDGLAGKTNHGHCSFRSYWTPGSVNIGGNWYFN